MAAETRCILDSLETGREGLPGIVAEIAVARTCGEDQRVV